MEQDTQKLIDEQFQKLPSNLQKAIQATPWKSKVNEIALLHNLGLEKVEVVERETMLIIYGFENPNNFIDNLAREVEVDEELASTIALEISEKIFRAISDKATELEKGIEPAPTVPAEAESNLPMVEPGEVAHNVAPATLEVPNPKPETLNNIQAQNIDTPKVEKPEEPTKPEINFPKSSYPDGKDPYREPLG